MKSSTISPSSKNKVETVKSNRGTFRSFISLLHIQCISFFVFFFGGLSRHDASKIPVKNTSVKSRTILCTRVLEWPYIWNHFFFFLRHCIFVHYSLIFWQIFLDFINSSQIIQNIMSYFRCLWMQFLTLYTSKLNCEKSDSLFEVNESFKEEM